MTPPGHPERIDRLSEAVNDVLDDEAFAQLIRKNTFAASASLVHLVHPPHFLSARRVWASLEGMAQVDLDTIISPKV